jgi:multidrug transporter EmrE-like cation transporter
LYSTRRFGGAQGLKGRLPMYAGWVAYGGLLGSALGLCVILVAQAGGPSAFFPCADFAGPYIGARLLDSGRAVDLYDLAAQQSVQRSVIGLCGPGKTTIIYTYPAWTAMLLMPLGALPFGLAYAVWTGLNATAIALSTNWLLPIASKSGRERVILLLAVLSFMPLLLTLLIGQQSIMALLSLAGTWLALRAGHERRAGVWLAIGLLKPPLLIAPLLALLVGRRWRTLAAFSLSSAALLGASLIVAGFWIPDYLKLLRLFVQPEQALGDFPWMMQNWRGLVYALLGADSDPLPAGLIAGLTLASLGVVAVICWPRPRRRGPAWDVCFAVAILLGVLIDPHLFLQDVAIAVLPGLVLWGAARGPDPRLRALRIGLMVAPFAARVAMSWSPPRIQVGPWFLALLLAVVAYAWPALRPVGSAEDPPL